MIFTCRPWAANRPFCCAIYKPTESAAGTAPTARSGFSGLLDAAGVLPAQPASAMAATVAMAIAAMAVAGLAVPGMAAVGMRKNRKLMLALPQTDSVAR